MWHHLHAAPHKTRAATPTAPPAAPNRHLEAFHALHDFLYGQFRDVFHAVDDKKEKDKDKVELSGTWVKKDAEMKVTFEKDTLKLAPHGKDDIILIECEYTADKNGLVKAKVTGHQGMEAARKAAAGTLPVGTEFTFVWKATKDTAKLDDVKGEAVDVFKSHFEGDFTEKK